jgi:predicted O-methyltransferase YrrM
MTTNRTKHALVEIVVGNVPCRGVVKQNKFVARSHSSDILVWTAIFVDHEFKFMDRIFTTVSPKNILDLGANAGYTAVYFANRYPAARIASVEASLGNFATASINILGNANVNLIWGAIWESQQQLSITPVDRGDW